MAQLQTTEARDELLKAYQARKEEEDRKRIKDALKREFKNVERDSQQKVRIGRTLLTDTRFNGDEKFIDVYAPWLIDQVIAQKPQLKKVLPQGQLTAVGEYANIVNSFQGYRDENFSKINDKRVIPILIAALDMPDNVYPEHQQGCVVRGNPGESTKRNLDRQNVPIALALILTGIHPY